MNNSYFDVLKDIYSCSEIKTMIADKDFNVCWSNDTELEKTFLGKNALSIFGNGSEIPVVSGKYSGIRNGVPYIYNVIFYNKKEEKFYVIELVSSDTIIDLFKIPSIMNYYTSMEASIRQSVFGISNSALSICDILEATESYNEMSIINSQMINCYKILKSIMNTNEIIKYIYDVMDIKTLNLSKFMMNTQEIVNNILNDKKACIIFEAEENLYIKTDEDRFMHIIANAIISIIKHTKGVPFVKVIAKKINEDILINFSNGDYDDNLIPKDFYSYANEFTNILTNNPYSSGLELYLLNTFCQKFNGKLYVVSGINGEMAFGIRFKSADKDEAFNEESEFESNISKYKSNKFSSFHIALADIYNFNFFDN